MEKMVRTRSSTDRAVEEEEKISVRDQCVVWVTRPSTSCHRPQPGTSGSKPENRKETRMHRLHEVMQEDDRRGFMVGG